MRDEMGQSSHVDPGPQVANGTLRLDIIAGLTGAVVVLPKAMAYATVAGLPISVGLYTAFVPMIVYALLGSSRVLSVSSTTTLAILTASQLALVVPDGDSGRLITATATLTALTGLILIAAAVMRLGFVANFMSASVLTGFKAGIGLVIVLDQLPKLFGLHVRKEGFFQDIWNLVLDLPETSVVTLGVGASALVFLFLLERVWHRSWAPLAILGAGVAASWLGEFGAIGVSIVGYIPQALPSLTLPDLGLALQLLPGACGIALMSFTETIAAGRSFRRLGDPLISPNRELLATGFSNLGGSLSGAMPAGGGTSQTAVVRAVGGFTQKASLVTAAAAVATMMILAPFLGLLPQAVLAAIVIVYSVGLISPLEFISIRKARRMEFRWALAAFIGVIFFSTLQGIVIAIILSLVGLSYQVANPRLYIIGRRRGEELLRPLSAEHADDETFAGLLILRPEGRLFFLNAQQVGDRIQELVTQEKPRVLLLDLSRVVDIEYSALQMIKESDRNLARQGVVLWLAGPNPQVHDYLLASGFAAQLGEDRIFLNVRAGLRHHQETDSATSHEATVAVGPA